MLLENRKLEMIAVKNGEKGATITVQLYHQYNKQKDTLAIYDEDPEPTEWVRAK